MDVAELNKLKVVDLRKMCQDRGLDQKGVKAVLVERLAEALGADGSGSSEGVPASREESMDADQNWESNDGPPQGHFGGEENDNAVETAEEVEEDFEGGQVVYNEMDDSQSNSYQQGFPEESQDNNQGFNYQQEDSSQFAEQQEQEQFEQQQQPEPETEQAPIAPEQAPIHATGANEFPPHPAGESLSQSADKPAEMDANGVFGEGVKQEYDENFAPNPIKEEPEAPPAVKPERQRKNRWGDKIEAQVVPKEEDQKFTDRGTIKRRHSPSPPRSRPSDQVPAKPDNEPPFDETQVLLGWYDSDLNLKIDPKNFTEASPMSDQAFAYIWAGARATFGFNSGKVYYEVKLVENNDTSHIDNEPDPNVMRIGWSVMYANMQLGEEPLSFGYGGTGKFSQDNKFRDYGGPFQVGNVVGAYLDFESNPRFVELSYSIDGQYLGVAHKIDKSSFGSSALFPHVLSKNVRFECNFGTTTWFPPLEGFRYAAHYSLHERIAGPRTPPTRGDCEIIMMCGLPGCGKTTWIKDYAVKHPEKLYNILGTNNLIDKMKVMGLPRKFNYAGRWDVLIEKCTKCLNKLLEIAAYRRRNYVIDQTNVYPTAQKRKMRNFVGFKRRAVVIVPTDEEFKKRCEKRDKEEGKDIPDSAVLDMKANFRLPEEGEIFDVVEFIELGRDQAAKLVEKYNKEGRDAGYGKKQFSGGSSSHGSRNDGRNDSRNDRNDSRNDKKFKSEHFKSEHDFGSRGGGDRWGGGGGNRWGGPDRGESRGGWQPRGGMDRDGDRGHRGRSDSRGRDDRGGRGGGWQDRSPMGRGGMGGSYGRGGGGPGGWRSRDDRDFDGGRGGPRGRGGFDRGGFRGRGRGGFDRGGFDRGGPRGRGGDFRGGPRGRGGFGDRDGGFGNRGGYNNDRGNYNDRGNFNDRSYSDRPGRGGDDKRRGSDDNRGGRNSSRDNESNQNRNQPPSGPNNMNQNQNASNWMQPGAYNQNQGWGAWGGYGQWGQYPAAAAATPATPGATQQPQQQQQQQQQGGWKQAGYGSQMTAQTATTQPQQTAAATANANYTQAYQQQAAAAYGQYPNAYNWNQYGQYAQQYSQWAQQWGQYGYGQYAAGATPAAGATGTAAAGAVAGAGTNTAVPPPAVANK